MRTKVDHGHDGGEGQRGHRDGGREESAPIYRSWHPSPSPPALWVRLRHPSLDMLNNHWQQSRMHLRDGPEIMVSQVKP